MADFPFVYNLTTGRAYYGPSMQDPKKAEPMWLTEQQKPYYEKAHPTSDIWKTVAAVGGVFASGFIPVGKGRLWDYYVRGIRAVEEYSPAQILRTFQLSTFFSQFESVGRRGFDISAELLARNQPYAQYLAKLIGTDEAWRRVVSEGVRLEGGKLLYGGGGVALEYASAIRVPPGASSYWGSGFARTIGAGNAFSTGAGPGATVRAGGRRVPLAHAFFAEGQPFKADPRILNPVLEGMPTQIIGGRNLPQYMWRQTGAWGTEFVSRFNRLLKAPFEMEPFRSIFGGLQRGIRNVTGKEIEFAVREAAGMKMLGALSLKYGLGLGAIYMSYRTLDHLVRNSDTLDSTAFAEGITSGIATLGVRANLLLSRVADATGLHSYREAQEEIAPGSTSLQKLLAFPLIGGMGAGFASYFAKTYSMVKMQKELGVTAAEARAAVVERMRSFTGKGPMAKIGKALTRQTGWYARQDMVGRVMRAIATPAKHGELSFKLLGKLGPTKLATAIGMGVGAALIIPFLPGALIPSQRPEELEAIYSGEQEVPIRKGRWWEFGRSPFEGRRIMYYRPHWYPRMLMRAREKAIWGEEEEEISPLEKWWRSEFTYELERAHYRERPYPITGLPFEDVPFIGPVLAHTIGKLIKPPLLMHTEEWMREGAVKGMPPRFGGRVATEVGEEPGGMPISPAGWKGLAGEQAYRMTEMIGLPGFAMVSMKEHLTGTGDLYDQMSQLESARRIAGFERYYWDLELGGLLGTTEAFRRLYPHRRRQIPLYNPIRNLMPEWLPGPGEKSPDFLHGDPYTKVPEGELRLPGRGYAERFPELRGVKPEEYPLIHRYKILADVAPWSDRYKQHLQMIRAARKRDEWTEYEENIYQTTMEQVKAKKTRTQFQEYEYLSPMGEIFAKGGKWGGEEASDLVRTLNEYSASKDQREDGLFKKMFGGYWELLAHNAETTIDSLTPIAPAAKLVHVRTALESYERTQVYGTENAFWQHPFRDFIKPFTQLLGRSFGYSGVPGPIESRRSLEEYFDILEYVKYTRLSNIARASGDSEAVKEFEARKDQTLFGINPYTRNYTSIFRALPRRDRDYFNSFADASSPEERARILELVPENEKGLYIARWKLAFADEVKKAKKAGVLSEDALKEADDILDRVYADAKTEGFPTSQELFAEYVATRMPGENYGDWYRRTRLLTRVQNVPGPDWVGWHPSVDLEDIKLSVVQTLGEDMHDYDLWQDQARSLVNKPYINDQAIKEILEPEQLTPDQIRGRINDLLTASNVRGDVFIRETYGPDNGSVDVDIEQEADEKDELRRAFF